MTRWANFAGYQAVWFAAAIGAGRGLWWPGVAAALAFCALHFALSKDGRDRDLRLLGMSLACGIVVDGPLAANGLVHYAAATPALPPGGAPLWILSLWAAFALTLRHSMRWLIGRPLAAGLLGAIGGPLAYLGAARGWQSLALAEPRSMSLAALALGWGLALPLLAWQAGKLDTSSTASGTALTGGAA